jgi:hypothetical protein
MSEKGQNTADKYIKTGHNVKYAVWMCGKEGSFSSGMFFWGYLQEILDKAS